MPVVAIGCIVVLATITTLGIESSARVLRWTAIAKLATIAVLIIAVLVRGSSGDAPPAAVLSGIPSFPALAGARAMHAATPRLYEPAVIDGRPNPRHLDRANDGIDNRLHSSECFDS